MNSSLRRATQAFTTFLLASLAGKYEFAGGLQKVTMALRGQTLTATILGQPTYRLVPSGERTFKAIPVTSES